jgi:hypothetical protein
MNQHLAQRRDFLRLLLWYTRAFTNPAVTSSRPSLAANVVCVVVRYLVIIQLLASSTTAAVVDRMWRKRGNCSGGTKSENAEKEEGNLKSSETREREKKWGLNE